MKKRLFYSTLCSTLLVISSSTFAVGSHGNHGGSKNKSGGHCKTTLIQHIKPIHLTTVAPESEFSFWVRGINDPTKVIATVKKISVKLDLTEMKGAQTVYAFNGKLPANIGKAARIQISVNDRRCPAEKGWLLKIAD